MRKQIDVYKEEAVKKKGEEEQLVKVLDDYKERFQEFDKSIKQSKKTLVQYEKEVGNMNRTINQLKSQKQEVIRMYQEEGKTGGGGGKKKNKKKGQQQVAVAENEQPVKKEPMTIEEQIAAIKTEWQKEKAEFDSQKQSI